MYAYGRWGGKSVVVVVITKCNFPLMDRVSHNSGTRQSQTQTQAPKTGINTIIIMDFHGIRYPGSVSFFPGLLCGGLCACVCLYVCLSVCEDSESFDRKTYSVSERWTLCWRSAAHCSWLCTGTCPCRSGARCWAPACRPLQWPTLCDQKKYRFNNSIILKFNIVYY